MRLRLHREAKAELREAAGWYSEQGPGLDDEFVAEAERVFRRVLERPYTHPVTRDGNPTIRAARLQRFPYRVVFRVGPNEVLVVAIAHDRRRPDYWRRRTRGV